MNLNQTQNSGTNTGSDQSGKNTSSVQSGTNAELERKIIPYVFKGTTIQIYIYFKFNIKIYKDLIIFYRLSNSRKNVL